MQRAQMQLMACGTGGGFGASLMGQHYCQPSDSVKRQSSSKRKRTPWGGCKAPNHVLR
jgi:hypothetical protein